MSSTMHQESLLPFHIFFTCPHCSAIRQVPEQYVGQSGACNTCGGAITVAANTAPPLPQVSLVSQPKSWYRDRMRYFSFCQEEYERARAQFSLVAEDGRWQKAIQEAAHCVDPAEQVLYWERLVAEGIPWSVAFEYLVHHYVKERNFERAYYFCCLYFHRDSWKNPQCVSGSKMLLKTMRKLDKKLHLE